jgi:hypothetical protein
MRYVAMLSLAASLVATPAAAEPIRPIYLGATANAQLGGQIANEPLPAWGGDLFVGVRVSRWVSLEGFFATRFTFDPIREPQEGAACSGMRTDWWQWNVAGARVWVHLLHLDVVDLSMGALVGMGLATDRNEPIGSPLAVCMSGGLYVSTDFAFSLGTPLALEIRPARWIGIRAMIGPTLDGSFGSYGFGALSWNGALGPVLRF